MNQQLTFADSEFVAKPRQTSKEVVPWPDEYLAPLG